MKKINSYHEAIVELLKTSAFQQINVLDYNLSKFAADNIPEQAKDPFWSQETASPEPAQLAALEYFKKKQTPEQVEQDKPIVQMEIPKSYFDSSFLTVTRDIAKREITDVNLDNLIKTLLEDLKVTNSPIGQNIGELIDSYQDWLNKTYVDLESSSIQDKDSEDYVNAQSAAEDVKNKIIAGLQKYRDAIINRGINKPDGSKELAKFKMMMDALFTEQIGLLVVRKEKKRPNIKKFFSSTESKEDIKMFERLFYYQAGDENKINLEKSPQEQEFSYWSKFAEWIKTKGKKENGKTIIDPNFIDRLKPYFINKDGYFVSPTLEQLEMVTKNIGKLYEEADSKINRARQIAYSRRPQIKQQEEKIITEEKPPIEEIKPPKNMLEELTEIFKTMPSSSEQISEQEINELIEEPTLEPERVPSATPKRPIEKVLKVMPKEEQVKLTEKIAIELATIYNNQESDRETKFKKIADKLKETTLSLAKQYDVKQATDVLEELFDFINEIRTFSDLKNNLVTFDQKDINMIKKIIRRIEEKIIPFQAGR